MKTKPLKIDLHVHTCYSEDATATLEEVEFYARKHGLDGVAVTDHETLEGARKLARKSKLLIIPGLEVETSKGHVLALNVTTLIPPRLSIAETVDKIHDAGGVAVLAHPAAVLKTRFGQTLTSRSGLDAVEVINSTSFPFFLTTQLSRSLANRLGLPKTAGSDSHHGVEVGTAYTLVDADSNPEDVTEAIKKGTVTPCGKSLSWAKRVRRGAFYLTNVRRRLYSP